MSRTPQDQITHLLSDLYAVELQALAQLETAPDLAGDAELAAHFSRHYEETKEQAELVERLLKARGGSSSKLKDLIMKAGGKGFLAFARIQNETPGRLLAHAYAFEAMEWAGYGVLLELAKLADDIDAEALARTIQAEEGVMMERLESCFDAVETLTHKDLPPVKLKKHLSKHLAECHAFEEQSLQLLQRAIHASGDSADGQVYARHLEETQRQEAAVRDRLEALGSGPSTLEDTAMKLGGFEWGLFFAAQKDTPAKLAAFVYAFEHLEIASYELLGRTARRVGDNETEQLCRELREEEQKMAADLVERFHPVAEETLREVKS